MGSLPQYVICKFLILRKLRLRVIFTSDSDLFMFNQKEKEERNTLTIKLYYKVNLEYCNEHHTRLYITDFIQDIAK